MPFVAAVVVRRSGTVGLVAGSFVRESTPTVKGFQEAKRWLAYGADHHDLLSRPEVYAVISAWLSGSDRAEDLLSRSVRAG